MQVILLQDIPKVGKKYTVADVSNGYAINFLYPQKLAEAATKAKIALLDKKREEERIVEEAKLATLKEKLESLSEVTVTITTKADDQGHLFKKLRAEDIVEALKKDADIELAKESILLDAPIHEVGDHEVPVEASETKAKLKVVVAAE